MQSAQGRLLWWGNTEQRPEGSKGGSPADYREQRIQTVGTVRTKLLSRCVLRGTSGKDAEVRGGGAVGFQWPKHMLSTHAELWGWGETQRSNPHLQESHWWLRIQKPGRITWGEERISTKQAIKGNAEESGEIPMAWEHLRRSIIGRRGNAPWPWRVAGCR